MVINRPFRGNNTVQKTIDLNTVMIDWLTVTSKAHPELDRASSLAVLELMPNASRSSRQRFMQFVGERWEDENGTLFYGYYNSDKTGEHTIVQVSGSLAHMSLHYLLPVVKNGNAKATRIDIQSTIEQPTGWEQIRFFNRMERAKRYPQWRSSIDQQSRAELVSVSIGSRESEAYARCYQKVTNDGRKLLRLEGEYKGGKAEAIARDMATHTPAQMLLWHVQKINDEELEKAFSRPLHGIAPHWAKASVTQADKTAEWLLSSALPAFKRVINQHSGDSGVSHAFMQAMIDAGKFSQDLEDNI